jgi:hypothetical protein
MANNRNQLRQCLKRTLAAADGRAVARGGGRKASQR